MKKIALFVFLIVIAFSANAQNKPSEEGTAASIGLILSKSNLWEKVYSIEGNVLYIFNQDYDTIGYYKNIHWDELVIVVTDFQSDGNYAQFDLIFKSPIDYYNFNEDEIVVNKETSIRIIVEETDYIIGFLNESFLQLKEIHK